MYFRDFTRPPCAFKRGRRMRRGRGAVNQKRQAKLSPWMLQLQWLRYVSICRPVERHQFIIIALNRPAPCTPPPSHSILPSIVQFRFYAVIALFSHRLRHFYPLLPPSSLFRFVSNVRISDSSLFSSSSPLLFLLFPPLPSILRDISTLSALFITLFTNENSLLFSPYLPPLTFSLHRSLSPLHLPSIARQPHFLRRSRYAQIKMDIEKRSGRNREKKKVFHLLAPSPLLDQRSPRLDSTELDGPTEEEEGETKGRQIGDCNLRGMDPRGVQGSGRTNNGKNGTARRNGRGEVGRASVGGGKRWRRRRGGGGKWRRKGRGRMQRIRKERSPAPAYVMPSGHCQPAPGPLPSPFVSRGGQGREGGRGERAELPPEPVAGKF